jgi:Tfp pilus assembly protein PilX
MIDRKHAMPVATYRQTKLGEVGLVSIMVSLVLMAVMTLIVLGFAEISRRDQREALDRQLSSQAFYAAESGVNDAHNIITAKLNTPNYNLNLLNKSNCANSTAPYDIDNSIDTGVSYTCLLVNTRPPSLLYSLSTQGTSKVVPIYPVNSAGNPTGINRITLNWKDTDSTVTTPLSGCKSSAQTLPSANSWAPCGYGLLRVDLVPINALGRASLLRNTFTGFFVPTNPAPGGPNAGKVSLTNSSPTNLYDGNANQGVVAAARCTNGSDGQCTVDITNVSSMNYYMRVSTLYTDASLQILACNSGGTCTPSNAVDLANAQALVDSTGKAQDVLRRIQVRIPISNNGGLFSDYAIESTNDISKQFCTYPGYASLDASSCQP